jgi:hypothetical protein
LPVFQIRGILIMIVFSFSIQETISAEEHFSSFRKENVMPSKPGAESSLFSRFILSTYLC